MSSDASFMTFGYRACLDVFMEKYIKVTWDANFVTFGYPAFFHIFMENPDKNDIGCLILDIWVSSFF